jgi:hypothetical protein
MSDGPSRASRIEVTKVMSDGPSRASGTVEMRWFLERLREISDESDE